MHRRRSLKGTTKRLLLLLWKSLRLLWLPRPRRHRRTTVPAMTPRVARTALTTMSALLWRMRRSVIGLTMRTRSTVMPSGPRVCRPSWPTRTHAHAIAHLARSATTTTAPAPTPTPPPAAALAIHRLARNARSAASLRPADQTRPNRPS